MRRKYDLRNKRNFMIITILMVAIICIFSLFIRKYNQASKILYKVETGSIIQDVNKNYLNTSEDAELRIRWNDNYYLVYQDKKINLGKKVIVYNTITGTISLYGKFYEIDSDGKIITHNAETKLTNTRTPKFYKLDDREYLLIDKSIVSTDRSINASNYLLVELDKLGNAKLSNDTLNLKTVSSTTLVTSNYKFDIANEKLTYNTLEIDLKKIIGSSNQYQEEEKTEEGKGEGSGTGTKTNITTKPTSNNNKSEKIDPVKIEEIKNKAKSTSIVRIVPGIRQIDVDYIIYDPYNEFTSVEARITKSDGIDVIPLPKNDTHIVLNNLRVNTTYRVEFIYTTISEKTGKVETHYIDEPMNITTKMPTFDIGIYKYSSNDKKLTYKVTLPNDYKVNEVNVTLTFKHRIYDDNGSFTSEQKEKTSKITVNTNDNVVYGIIDLHEYNIDRDSSLKLTIDNVKSSEGTLIVNKTYSFKFAR